MIRATLTYSFAGNRHGAHAEPMGTRRRQVSQKEQPHLP
jgi:hypothetical protein